MAKAKNRLTGNRYVFPKVSVGAAHVLMMAASLAKGETVWKMPRASPKSSILPTASTPWVARFMAPAPKPLQFRASIICRVHAAASFPTALATGTYAMAVAMTGGDVLLQGAQPELLQDALDVIAKTGAEITTTNEGIHVRNGAGISPVDVTTEPFQASTNLQAQFMGLMTMAKGKSHITETIFENRFMHVQELALERASPCRAVPPSLRASKSSRARQSWRPTCARLLHW